MYRTRTGPSTEVDIQENKEHHPATLRGYAATGILFLVREMVINRLCPAVGRKRGLRDANNCSGKMKHRERYSTGNCDLSREKIASESPTESLAPLLPPQEP